MPPITAPAARLRTTTTGMGSPSRTTISAASAPTKAATEPTDRSIWPATMISNMPTAMMTMWLFCRNRLVRLTGRNRMPPVTTWKKAIMMISANRMPYSRMLRRMKPNVSPERSVVVSDMCGLCLDLLGGNVFVGQVLARPDDDLHDTFLRGLCGRHLSDQTALVHDQDAVGDAQKLGHF